MVPCGSQPSRTKDIFSWASGRVRLFVVFLVGLGCASAVAALAHLRFPNDTQNRKIEVDLERTATFLFSTYIATIAGMGKQDPDVKSKLKSKFSISNQLHDIF